MHFCYTNFRKLKGSHILKYGNNSTSFHRLIIDTFLTTIHLIKGIFSKMSILSLCILDWLALLGKKLHFCIFRLWKKNRARFLHHLMDYAGARTTEIPVSTYSSRASAVPA